MDWSTDEASGAEFKLEVSVHWEAPLKHLSCVHWKGLEAWHPAKWAQRVPGPSLGNKNSPPHTHTHTKKLNISNQIEAVCVFPSLTAASFQSTRWGNLAFYHFQALLYILLCMYCVFKQYIVLISILKHFIEMLLSVCMLMQIAFFSCQHFVSYSDPHWYLELSLIFTLYVIVLHGYATIYLWMSCERTFSLPIIFDHYEHC